MVAKFGVAVDEKDLYAVRFQVRRIEELQTIIGHLGRFQLTLAVEDGKRGVRP
jgi:hypothetical protein